MRMLRFAGFSLLTICFFLKAEVASACVDVPGIAPLLDWSDTIESVAPSVQERRIVTIMTALDRDEFIRAAHRVGGGSLSFEALQQFDKITAYARGEANFSTVEFALFLARLRAEAIAYCSKLDAVAGHSSVGARGVDGQGNSSQGISKFSIPGASYEALRIPIIAVFLLIILLVMLDVKRRRRFVESNRRVTCKVPGSLSFFEKRIVGTLVIVGQQGFRFEIEDLEGLNIFGGFNDDLVYMLEAADLDLGCRVFYTEVDCAGFLFLRSLTESEYEAIIAHSQVKPEPHLLSIKEHKRVQKAGRI